jgi:hypothetical protein
VLTRPAARALADVLRIILGSGGVAVVSGRVSATEVRSWEQVCALGPRLLGWSEPPGWGGAPIAACMTFGQPEPVTLMLAPEMVRPPPQSTSEDWPVQAAYRVARRFLTFVRERPGEEHVRRAQLSALEGQIRPHFLFNALTTIQAYVRERPGLAEELIGSLALYVRTALSRGEGLVFVAEELTLVQVYLGLERARLGNRLRTVLDVDPAALGLRMPSLLVQPLVENAVVHAAARQPEGATLRLAVRAQSRGQSRGQRLLLMVADDGPGFAPGAATPHGDHNAPIRSGLRVGLRNVQLRLEAIYGGRARLRLLRRPGGGTIAAVSLPVGRLKRDRLIIRDGPSPHR